MTDLPDKRPDSEILIYQTEDGRTRIQVRLENETVWLTQADMAQLFQTTPQNITGRADANRPLMGLISWAGAKPGRSDIEIAKNYLTAEELDTLNRIVSILQKFRFCPLGPYSKTHRPADIESAQIRRYSARNPTGQG